MTTRKTKVRRVGIALRTALLLWLVTLVTLFIFIVFIVPLPGIFGMALWGVTSEQLGSFLEKRTATIKLIMFLLRPYTGRDIRSELCLKEDLF